MSGLLRGSAALLALLILLVGCDQEEPTRTPGPTSLPASPTVNVQPPTLTDPEAAAQFAVNYTPGAVPTVIGGATITPTPEPTLQSLEMQFIADDGLIIEGSFYAAPVRPAPLVLLLHMVGSSKEAWSSTADQLQMAGFSVLAIDLRGHGLTGGDPDWVKAQQDVITVLRQAATLSGVQADHISVIGASIGANLGINACAALGTCRSVVLISAGLSYLSITSEEAVRQYGAKPLLLIASRDDPPSGADSVTLNGIATGDHRLILNSGSAHGTTILDSDPMLIPTIIGWLKEH